MHSALLPSCCRLFRPSYSVMARRSLDHNRYLRNPVGCYHCIQALGRPGTESGDPLRSIERVASRRAFLRGSKGASGQRVTTLMLTHPRKSNLACFTCLLVFDDIVYSCCFFLSIIFQTRRMTFCGSNVMASGIPTSTRRHQSSSTVTVVHCTPSHGSTSTRNCSPQLLTTISQTLTFW